MLKTLALKRLIAILIPTAASMLIPGAVLATPGYKLVAGKLGPMIVKVVTDKIIDKKPDNPSADA